MYNIVGNFSAKKKKKKKRIRKIIEFILKRASLTRGRKFDGKFIITLLKITREVVCESLGIYDRVSIFH